MQLLGLTHFLKLNGSNRYCTGMSIIKSSAELAQDRAA